ncbi:MAG: tetratricopeptide repeat protein, partial [Planctomycetota bacterium]
MIKRKVIAGLVLLLFFSHCGYAKELSTVADKYMDEGRWDKAIGEYGKLLEKNKKQPEIYFKLGN